MKKETIWNIILIASIILLINGMTKTGSQDKKEAQAGQDQTTLGVVGVASSFIGRKLMPQMIAAAWLWGIILTVGLMIPKILTGFINIFRPQPTIPMFVWVIAGFILLMLVMRRK